MSMLHIYSALRLVAAFQNKIEKISAECDFGRRSKLQPAVRRVWKLWTWIKKQEVYKVTKGIIQCI